MLANTPFDVSVQCALNLMLMKVEISMEKYKEADKVQEMREWMYII